MGRGGNRIRIIPKRILTAARARTTSGLRHSLATSIMRDPVAWFCAAGGLMVALALPALSLALTGGDNRGCR